MQQLEFNLAFDSWARPQYEALQQRICDGASSDLGFQTSGIDMLIDDETDISAPIIEEFLYLFDDEAGMVDAQTYSETVITSQIFADDTIVPFEP